MNPICTVYTDASVCPHTKASAWGAWIKYDGLSFRFSAPFKEIKESVTTAEMAAIACGLFRAKPVVGDRVSDTLFVIVSDCQDAIRKMSNPRACRTREERDIEAYVRIDSAESGYRLKINKVKGHSRHDGARSAVNDIVHKLALREMRKLRAELS